MSHAEFDSIAIDDYCFVCHDQCDPHQHLHEDFQFHNAQLRRVATEVAREAFCNVCNVNISPHLSVAEAHVRGRKHLQLLRDRVAPPRKYSYDSWLTVEEEDQILICENCISREMNGCPMCYTSDFGVAHCTSQQHIDSRRQMVDAIQRFGRCDLACGAGSLDDLSYQTVASHIASGMHLAALEERCELVKCILQSGQCSDCQIPVARHPKPALQHLIGEKHAMRLKMKSISKDDKLMARKDAVPPGYRLLMRVDGVYEPRARETVCPAVTIEVGQSCLIEFEIFNDTKFHTYWKHAIGTPLSTFEQFGVPIKSPPHGTSVHPRSSISQKIEIHAKPEHQGAHKCIIAFQLENGSPLMRAFELRIVSKRVKIAPQVALLPLDVNTWIKQNIVRQLVTQVGIDTESALQYGKPNKLALIQIATPSNEVLLYRVYEQDGIALPVELIKLLLNPNITKYTVGSEKELQKRCELPYPAMVDVQARERLPGQQLQSTTKLAAKYAPEHGYSKSKSLQVSDWSAWPLSQQQIDYAAKDAIIALAIGNAMDRNLAVPSSHSSASAATFPSRVERIGYAFGPAY